MVRAFVHSMPFNKWGVKETNQVNLDDKHCCIAAMAVRLPHLNLRLFIVTHFIDTNIRERLQFEHFTSQFNAKRLSPRTVLGCVVIWFIKMVAYGRNLGCRFFLPLSLSLSPIPFSVFIPLNAFPTDCSRKEIVCAKWGWSSARRRKTHMRLQQQRACGNSNL